MNIKKSYCLVTALVFLSACSKGEPYTLYRGSPVIENARIHVASFNANEKEGYNMENCQIAAELFQK